MKQKFLLLIICSLCFSFANAQITIDFEDAVLADTNFVAGGFQFILDGDFLISEFDNFSCDDNSETNRYMDSGYLDTPSEIVLGSITPANPVVTFQLSTSVDQCAWPGGADGEHPSAATIRFIGIKTDASTIQEEIEITSSSLSDLVSFTFSEAIWNDVDLKSLQIEIAATQDSTDYFALDNLVFEKIEDPTSTNTINGQKIDIFPNPTTGILNIKGIQAERIQIIDIFGRILLIENDPDATVDIADLPTGVYFLKLEADEQFIISRISKN